MEIICVINRNYFTNTSPDLVFKFDFLVLIWIKHCRPSLTHICYMWLHTMMETEDVHSDIIWLLGTYRARERTACSLMENYPPLTGTGDFHGGRDIIIIMPCVATVKCGSRPPLVRLNQVRNRWNCALISLSHGAHSKVQDPGPCLCGVQARPSWLLDKDSAVWLHVVNTFRGSRPIPGSGMIFVRSETRWWDGK